MLEQPPLSDYDRMALKFQKQTKKRKVGSAVAQLGTLSKQSIPPLKVLLDADRKMLEFGMDANLTPAQILGTAEIETHKGPARRPYEVGTPLLWERLLKELPTRMYEFHNGTCKWREVSGGWNISKLKLKSNIISEVAPLLLLA